MMTPPKSLVNLAADVRSAYTAWRLKRPGPGHRAQHQTFASLARQIAPTARGRQAGIEPGMRYETFRERVRPETYESLEPYVDRMKRGEADVLWPGTCGLFAASAGTTTGVSRDVPVTDAMLAHFRRAGLEALFYYTARAGGSRVLRGRHLFLAGGSHSIPAGELRSSAAFVGETGAIAAPHLPPWAKKHLYEPGREISQVENWEDRLHAIVERVRSRNITLIAGSPASLLDLADALGVSSSGGGASHLRAIWPRLQCIVHGGVPLEPFGDRLRATVGPDVDLHEVYSAPEGLIAAQDRRDADGLRLLAESGIFFEFLPMPVFIEDNLRNLGSHAVSLEGVKTGIDYALLLTTPAGLCRHVIGDVVQFVSTDPPRLQYVGRTRLKLDAFAEQVVERQLIDSLVTVSRRHGWAVVNFHVAPLFAATLTGQIRGSHEWWLELKVPTIETPTANVIGPELDAELQARSETYAQRRREKHLESPAVRLVMPGVFDQWLRKTGRRPGGNTVPRCRSDREVADQLSELSRFHVETRPPYVIRPH